MRPVPVGIPGELFTGGDGLAIGYLNQPGTHRGKIHHSSGIRTALPHRRSLPLAPDGTIEFLGRRDHQVKVRGFRIELGEIEAFLTSHPQVRQAKVAVRGDTAETKRIVAWVVPAEGASPEPAALAAFLAERLPAFMQPDGIAVLESFPLSANGKVDLSALPDPSRGDLSAEETAREAPVGGRNPTSPRSGGFARDSGNQPGRRLFRPRRTLADGVADVLPHQP